jgi:hypothetical protein
VTQHPWTTDRKMKKERYREHSGEFMKISSFGIFLGMIYQISSPVMICTDPFLAIM